MPPGNRFASCLLTKAAVNYLTMFSAAAAAKAVSPESECVSATDR